METIDGLQRVKYDLLSSHRHLTNLFRLDCEEKQHFYDEQITRMKSMEKQMINEGPHYQQLLKRYYELGDELVQARNALKRLKQQHDTRLM